MIKSRTPIRVTSELLGHDVPTWIKGLPHRNGIAFEVSAGQSEAMAVPRDYDVNPERFRLGVRITDRYLTGAKGIYEHIARLLGRDAARLVADIGCGEGALTKGAAHLARTRIVGVDASTTMLASHPGPRVLADARRLPFASGSFDAAVAANMLYHFDDPTVVLAEARRVIRRGGLFIATAISRDDSPELAAVWKPSPSTFDAEDAARIVALVFKNAIAERWDAPLVTLPDHDAVRDYLIARFVPPRQASAAAARIETPLTITKRGAYIRARRLTRPTSRGPHAGSQCGCVRPAGVGSGSTESQHPSE